MDEKSNLRDDLIAEIKQEPESLDMTPLTSFRSILRQALGYDDLTPIDLTKHISVALRSSSGSNAIAEREAGSDILRFFASGEYPATSLKVSIVPVQEGTGDPSPENIRPITGWTAVKVYQAAEYDEEAEPVIEVALGDDAGTVYGGMLDAVTGVLTVTHAGVDLESLSWSTRYSGSSNKALSANLPSTYYGYERGSMGSPFQAEAFVAQQSVNGVAALNSPDNRDVGLYWLSNASSQETAVIYGVMGLNDSPTGMVVYELADPLTYELDPEELSTLIGENNIWADCGPVESITY